MDRRLSVFGMSGLHPEIRIAKQDALEMGEQLLFDELDAFRQQHGVSLGAPVESVRRGVVAWPIRKGE